MIERVDKVEEQMMTIRSNLKTETYLAMDYRGTELKTNILTEVDPKVIALETRLMHHINEDRQTMANHLQEINDLSSGSPRWSTKDVGSH